MRRRRETCHGTRPTSNSRPGPELQRLENGRSTLQKCAYVENYLGFPLGIEPRDLLEIMQTHVAQTPCTVQEATVETVRRTEDGFDVIVDEEPIPIRTVLAASWSKSDYLVELGAETEPVAEIMTDPQGRTNVEGVYGRLDYRDSPSGPRECRRGSTSRPAPSLRTDPGVLQRLGRTSGVLRGVREGDSGRC